MKLFREYSSAAPFASVGKYRRRRRLAVIMLVVVLLIVAAYALLRVDSSASVSTGDSASVKDAPAPPKAKKQQKSGKSGAKKKQLAKGPPLPVATQSCDDPRVLVDHKHPLPPGYVPQDLVSLAATGMPTLTNYVYLRREAADHLGLLIAAAAADGEDLTVASAYRSYTDQQASHDKWEAFYGDPNAGGMSALPGHSQHQLGTAVDFTNSASEYKIWQVFGRTSGSAWLEKNAGEYGFVLAYPENQTAETGYQWEPWHYRYIGVQNIRRMKDSGMSLQSFLTEEGVTPRC